MWDTGTGECLSTLTGHNGDVFATVFSADSSLIASGSYDTNIKIWSTTDGTLLSTLRDKMSVRSNILVSGGNDMTVRVWDLERGECLRIFTGHSGWVSSVDISECGSFIASGSRDRTIKVWSLDETIKVRSEEGPLFQTIDTHLPVCSVKFSSNRTLISGFDDPRILIWTNN